MLRQGLAFRSWFPLLLRSYSFGSGLQLGMSCLFLFELKLELFKLDDDLLALGAEDHVPQLLDHELQMVDPLAA